MSTAKQSGPVRRIRLLAAVSVRLAIGPIRDESRLDRMAIGAAGGILVLAAVGLPVTVANVAASKTVPSYVLVLCVVAGIIGLALITKSCQRPIKTTQPEPTVSPLQNPLAPNAPSDLAPKQPDVSSSTSAIDVSDSKLTKSGINIPEDSKVTVVSSELSESPLTIRNRSLVNNKPDNE